MISGATYREGVASNSDGVIYIYIEPATITGAVFTGGAAIAPPSLALTSDGAIYVRFV